MPKKPKKKTEDGDGKPVLKEGGGTTQTKLNKGKGEESQTIETGTQDPQTSESAGESDSVNPHEPQTVIPFQRSGGTGSENLPMVAPDADDQNSKPLETPTDELAGASDADSPQTLNNDRKPKEDHEKDKELSKERIDELVHRAMANRDKADNAALETGQMLLDEVFGGNLSEACSRNPKKNNSFKSIVEYEEMDLDATTLARWVKAANLVNTFQKKGKKFKHLTCSHYIALLALKEDKSKLRLAEEAEENRFSVRRLALEVDKAEPHSRPPKTLLDTITSKLENPRDLADEEKSGSLSDRAKWAGLATEDRDTLIKRVSIAKLLAQTYVNTLARFHALLKEIVAGND